MNNKIIISGKEYDDFIAWLCLEWKEFGDPALLREIMGLYMSGKEIGGTDSSKLLTPPKDIYLGEKKEIITAAPLCGPTGLRFEGKEFGDPARLREIMSMYMSGKEIGGTDSSKLLTPPKDIYLGEKKEIITAAPLCGPTGLRFEGKEFGDPAFLREIMSMYMSGKEIGGTDSSKLLTPPKDIYPDEKREIIGAAKRR